MTLLYKNTKSLKDSVTQLVIVVESPGIDLPVVFVLGKRAVLAGPDITEPHLAGFALYHAGF